MHTFHVALEKGIISAEEAFQILDDAPAIDCKFMIGAWRGFGFPTGHPSDHSLTSQGWYGKTFHSLDNVDPLVFSCKDGGVPWAADPEKIMAVFERSATIQDSRAECESDKAEARLRRVEYRGQTTAAMVYNKQPIIDIFQRIDDTTVLGVMDNPQIAGRPFFFYLVRD